MDSRHTPNDIPFKLTARWFGPFTVLQVKGAQATLDLPSTFGKAHRQVNIARLIFFEPRDSKLGDANLRPQPLWGHDWVPHDEISRICNARCHKGVDELWVEWKGYDQSQNGWVARSSLLNDVPHLVHAFEANPSVFITRKSEHQQLWETRLYHLRRRRCPTIHWTQGRLRVRWFWKKKYSRYRVDSPSHFALWGESRGK